MLSNSIYGSGVRNVACGRVRKKPADCALSARRSGSGSGIRGLGPGEDGRCLMHHILVWEAALMCLNPGGQLRKRPSPGELLGTENSPWLFDRFFFSNPPTHLQLYHGRRAKARGKGDILKIASPEAGEAAFYRKTSPDARFFPFRLFGAFRFVLPPEKRYIEPVRRGLFGPLSGAENRR